MIAYWFHSMGSDGDFAEPPMRFECHNGQVAIETQNSSLRKENPLRSGSKLESHPALAQITRGALALDLDDWTTPIIRPVKVALMA
jgi:hypothetical protein